MASLLGLQEPFQPNWEKLVDNLRRRGDPDRVHNIELFHDAEVVDAIVDRFDLAASLDPASADFERRKTIAFNRFCGLDYVRVALDLTLTFHRTSVEDTAALKRSGGREFQDSRTGPIMSWEEFEKYAWPDPESPAATAELQWYQEHLPDDMCLIGGTTAHFCERLLWLMGYEPFCYALFEQPDLVRAVAEKIREFYLACVGRYMEFDRVKALWASDDMGFKTGLFFSPDDMRRLVLNGHKAAAEIAHQHDRLYLLHSCGQLDSIIDDLVDDVGIDGKHSYEDTILTIQDAKRTFGRKVAVLGGIDVDFLCRSDEPAIRRRVRETIDVCQPGGGLGLGTGNTVANYIPLDNYLAMIDEGRLYAGR